MICLPEKKMDLYIYYFNNQENIRNFTYSRK